jgi:hypothetical protein
MRTIVADTVDFPGSTHDFGPPPGLDEMVGRLHIFSNGRTVVSAWKPTPEEIAKIVAGELIFVSVMSGSQWKTLTSDDGTESKDFLVPIVYPMYVGCEAECKAVASDTGPVW